MRRVYRALCEGILCSILIGVAQFCLLSLSKLHSILIKPSNTTKYVFLLSLLLSRTTCFGPLSDHHQVFKS